MYVLHVVRYAGDLGAVTEIWGGALVSVGAATPFDRLHTILLQLQEPVYNPPSQKKSKLLHTNNISCLYAVNLTENLARLVSKQHCQGVECDGCGKQHKS